MRSSAVPTCGSAISPRPRSPGSGWTPTRWRPVNHGWLPASSAATGTTAPTPTARPTTCWCRPRRGGWRGPAPAPRPPTGGTPAPATPAGGAAPTGGPPPRSRRRRPAPAGGWGGWRRPAGSAGGGWGGGGGVGPPRRRGGGGVRAGGGGRGGRLPPPPVTHSGFGPALGPVPRHGEHTDAVLAELAAEAED